MAETSSANRRNLFGVAGELFEALQAADASTPPTLEAFDRIVSSHDPLPSFYEHSVRVAHPISPHRLTYYFDTHGREPHVAREAGARFVRLGRELGLRLPLPLADFVEADGPGSDEVLQVVLGVDAPIDGSALRGKYYLVFRSNPGRCVSELLAAAGLAPAAGALPEKVYIVGVDVTAAGIDDVKLYFRLESRRAPRVIDNMDDVADLLAASRDVVFQQGTRRPERRQVYVHASSTAHLSEWLERHGFDEALGRARAINERLCGSRIDPWIVSFAYDQRRVDVGSGTVYFHLARGN